MPRDLGIVEETLFRKLDRSGTLGRGDRYTGNEKIDKFAKEWNDLRPGWNEFLKQEIYTKEQINEDKRKVESIKNSPDYIKERSEKAVALEYILMEIINSNNALGEGVNVYPASEFDDFVNSTDFVVRFPGEQEGEFFYLAVDATISDDPTVIDNKLKRSTYGLRNNNLPELKYFIDEERDKPVKGKISMPKVVINISDNKLNRVIDSFTADRTYAFDDALRQEIIDEIKKQLEKNEIGRAHV